MTYQFANINGIQMHFDVQGSGSVLLLIHAGIANLNMWDAQVKAFAPHFRVIRHDVRGFGETPNPTGKYTDYADVKALLDFLGVSKTSIVGISKGGRIALKVALTYPDLVSKLVLVAPGLPGFKAPDDPLIDEMSAQYDEATKTGDKERFDQIETRLWIDGPKRKPEDVDPSFRKQALELVRHTINLGIGEGKGDIARPPAGERLGEIKASTLLIIGEEDLQSMHAIADEIEKKIPNLNRVDLPGTAHLPPMEKPEEFNRLVLDFLRD